MRDKRQTLEKLQRIYFAAETGALVVLLLTALGIAAAQIILRNFFGTGLVWAEPALRAIVLWLGCFGAIAACRGEKHIKIDFLLQKLSARARHIANATVSFLVMCICVLLAYHTARFVHIDFIYGIKAPIGVPAWMVEIIIPFTFIVVALRFLFSSITQGIKAFRYGATC